MILRAILLVAVVAVAAARASESGSILPRLVAGNDELAARALAVPATAAGLDARSESIRVLVLTCAYVSPLSKYHRDPAIPPLLRQLAARIRSLQHPSGLFDVGNLESPPDTGFAVEALARAQQLLLQDAAPATAELRDELRPIITAAALGVAGGGVHTPNHRWGVSAALALVQTLYPDPRYPARIDDWLGEGIDQDADGQYAERSPAYSAYVVNPAFLVLAELHGRRDLVEVIRRNLQLSWRLTEADGEMVTVASRRQDQRAGARASIASCYLPARWLAIHTGDKAMAALARLIEERHLAKVINGVFDPCWALPSLLVDPALAGPLPAGGALPEAFAVTLPGSGLARVRHGAVTATVYGGSDHGAGLGTGSGLAMNPTFFVLRHGAAQVALRLTPAFFGTGFFYAQGLERTAAGWRLHQQLQVPYHLPLPPEKRRADGNYALTADGRYFSKLDFPSRPKEFRTLDTAITVREEGGEFVLDFAVTGQAGVPVTLELACTGRGELSGVTPLAGLVPARPASWLGRGGYGAGGGDQAGAFALQEGTGIFRVGADAIAFGPASYTQFPGRMEGEDYTWVNGSLEAEGQRVYLTGVSPWRHTLRLKATTAN